MPNLSIITEFLKQSDLIAVLLMPFTYGFIGWFTNWVALKMTFYPIRFYGIPPYLGWQGIIPRKAHKMASKSVDIITGRLLKIEEVFDKVEPSGIERELRPLVEGMIEETTRDVVEQINPTLWVMMPEPMKQDIYKKARAQIPGTFNTIVTELRTNILQVFDLKGMVLKKLSGDNVKLVVDMFQSIGKPEFKFIEISGLYFGLLLGSIQMVIWFFFPIWWTLPIQGVLVGYLTNFLALEMIFRPYYPKKYFGFYTYQGLFLKRQDEVARQYSKFVAENVLNARNILEEILYGKAADAVYNIIRNSAIRAIEETSSMAQPLVSLAVGQEKYKLVRSEIVAKMMALAPQSIDRIEDYVGKAMDLEETMYDRMRKLSPEEFESVLRSAFQEDELLLILVGAALGALVGLFQAIYLVGGF
ncbi:MAG: DUF445 family protein [Leptospiraceae bacterium]|nr:DUF445 family protein [Leptospiraceae bacterium]MCP5513438.1 DUF445 family protein [Leptospiraceae bacterium]